MALECPSDSKSGNLPSVGADGGDKVGNGDLVEDSVQKKREPGIRARDKAATTAAEESFPKLAQMDDSMATYTDLEGDWSMLNQEIQEWTATGKFLYYYCESDLLIHSCPCNR